MAVDEAQKLDAEYDSDDESSPDLEWMLGFAEEPAQRSSLLRHHFPSKVGGAPAWLDPVDLPHEDQLICGLSGLPLDFLCQLYAPVDTPSATAFHRTILLFISPKGSKLHLPGAVRAFRCQLPRGNPFYSFEPPDEGSSPPALTLEQQTELGNRDRWASPEAATRVYKELHLDVEPEEDGYEEDDEGDEGPEKLSNGALCLQSFHPLSFVPALQLSHASGSR
ncbi:hypothetical protein CYMTET_45695 [Cymbomonas tetramitiformis]|uniref:Uncharacterized protein n=1 Tax=Cymbomonas tetramitiformis TaxID=36881 RepID=A0AAE0BXQ4_9CHLO|nr:hypothetical protein CYMTET_45695 [Cymbomonas tetramitiformis]